MEHPKLNADNMNVIRRAYLAGVSQSQLGKIYGVSQKTISKIVRLH
jgi:DNA-binding XRE family transcriptional regulator